MKRYEKYKPSGVDWIGDIPQNWKVLTITKFSTRVDYRGKTPEKVESGTFLITTRNIKNGLINYEISKEYVSDKNFNEIMSRGLPEIGDILFTMEAPLGNSAIVDRTDVAIAQRIIKFRFNSQVFVNEFVNYSFISSYFQNKVQREGTGSTAKGIKASKLGLLKIICPTLAEQKSIASFLDDKTSKVDQTISLKQKEINLLKERRQILIQKAVTKGLNDQVKMKDSGVDWIGEIPEHWEVLPGFKVYKENKSNNTGMKENVVLSLSYGNIVIKPEEKLVGLVPESFETYQIVKPGDIIIRCMDLQNDKTSLRTGIAVDNGIITNAYLNLNIIDGNDSNYYYNFLHTLDTTKVIYKFGKGLRQNLSYSDFKRMPIIVPPVSEQKQIAAFIQSLKNKIAKTISIKEQEIERLKEYKTVLIDKVVTGKVKVN